MGEAESKGQGVVSAVRGLRSVCTEAEWQRAVQAMSPASRELAVSPPLPVVWVKAEAITGMIETAYKVALGGNNERLLTAARTAIKGDLNSLYKVFIRLASPQWVIDRASKLWETYSRNNGTVTSKVTGERSAQVLYSNIAVVAPSFWLYQQGGMTAVLEATGMKRISVKLVSGGGNAHDGVFDCTWES